MIVVLCLIVCSCSMKRKIVNNPSIEKCLTLDPLNSNNSDFNPKWVSKNGITKIIEREYLDGKNGKIHLVSVMDFNSDGYIKTKYSGKGYPQDDSPNEEDIVAKWIYTYENQDSFIVQKSKVVRFYNQQEKLEEPDTLREVRKIIKLKSAKSYTNKNDEVIRTYNYDKKNRLLEAIDGKGKSIYKLEYPSDNIIQVEIYSHWHKKYAKSWVTLNNKGQIIKTFDESNNGTHKFLYNKKGEMIEEEFFFKDKAPNYLTYEYQR